MTLPPNAIPVLDHGFVRLDGADATDLSVVNAARVSFNKYQDAMDDRGAGLIRFLMREKHGSPFEHNFFRFHVRAPLFVIREWQRHRIASYNEESGRYSEFEPMFYIPNNIRQQVGKPGAYTFEPVDDEVHEITRSVLLTHSEDAFARYRRLLDIGVAKEVARMVLPLNLYSSFFFSANARGLMNFLALRNSEFAQFEIREYAKALEKYFSDYMPATYEAFVGNGRVCP